MRRLRLCSSVLTLLCLVAVSFAQTAKPTRTVVTLTDGTTVSGELVEATPAGVTLKPNAKADPVVTPWSKIKRVGGGITRDAIVAEWQKTKAAELCETCKGEAATQCTTCAGTSVDLAQKKPCDKCEGTGSTGACRTPNEVEGKIPCPNTCLKLESFTGPKDADGKRWRSFRGKGGLVQKVSDGHVGQRVVYQDGNPTIIQEPCPTCEGTTRVVDPACKGTGQTVCVTCKGHGVVGPDCATCELGKLPCATCSGTGLKAVATPAAPTGTGAAGEVAQ